MFLGTLPRLFVALILCFLIFRDNLIIEFFPEILCDRIADILVRLLTDPNTTFDAYNAVNAGVDMRNISTDNIESVEIIRGIPSVEYNDLTSGVVIIKQKQKATPVEARIKADQYGKLFSIGKGVEWKDQRTVLSADAGFLDSYNDPRDRLNNFKRINASVRLNLHMEYGANGILP